MKRTSAFLVLSLCLLGVVGCANNRKVTVEFNIIHTNDIHGYVEGQDISLSQIATLKDTIDNAILVDAGDATQGAPFATLSKGEDVIKMMNATGYDMMALGNHEFDSGIEQLKQNQSLAEFPMLSCNTYAGDELLMKTESSNGAYTIKTIDKVKIGIIGVTTRDTATSSNPSILDTVEFKEEITEVKKTIEEIKNKTDTIVIVSHLGDIGTSTAATSIVLRDALVESGYKDEVACIIDGHSHTVINNDDGILVAQTGTALESVGIVNVKIKNGVKTVTESLRDGTDIAKKDTVTTLYESIESEQSEFLDTKFATIPNSLIGGTIGGYAFGRFAETNLGDLITDAMLKKMKETFSTNETYKNVHLVAVENGGGIRGSLNKGDITYRDLLTVFPYGNTVQFKLITASTLYEVMELSLSANIGYNTSTGILSCQDNSPSGGFLQISGFSVYYDPNEPVNQKVKSIILDDNTVLVRDNLPIIIGTNNYLLSGGNSYSMFTDKPVVGETLGELDLLESYLAYLEKNPAQFAQYRSSDTRISIVDAPASYQAKIAINGTFNKVTVDGVEVTLASGTSYYTTDVTDGLHVVTVDNVEFIVCNYSGHGISNVVNVDLTNNTYNYIA